MPSWYGHDVWLVISESSWLLWERVYAELIWQCCPACDRESAWLQVIRKRERETMPSWYGHNVRLVMRWVIVHGYKLYCKRETIELIWPRCLACDEVSDSSWLLVILWERDYAELIWPRCPACDEVSDSSWLQVILQERERLYRVDMATMSGLWWGEW